MTSFTFGNTKFKLINVLSNYITTDIQGHAHSKNSFELHYIAKGSGILNIDSASYKLKKGQFYVTGPEIWHQQLTDKNDPIYEYCIYFQIEEKPQDIISQIFCEHTFYMGYDNKTIKNAFEQVVSLKDDKTVFAQQKQSIFIQLIMNELASLYSPSVISRSFYTIEDRQNVIIEDAFLYDYKNVTLTSLSDSLGLSERQTQRLILKNFGRTFSRKKTEARLEKAKLLLEENHKIADISKAVGYSNVSAFERAYKKHFGKTPKGRE